MRLQQILFSVIAIASFLGSPLSALADDDQPPPRPGKEFCKENPGKCAEARARHQEFCTANPEKCEQMKQKRAERREFCTANPEKCKEQREAMKARRAEMQAKCQADPAKCDEMKEQARKKFQDRMGTAPPPPAPR